MRLATDSTGGPAGATGADESIGTSGSVVMATTWQQEAHALQVCPVSAWAVTGLPESAAPGAW